jgi:hypothetical protein
MNSPDLSFFTIPLGRQAHDRAREFARQSISFASEAQKNAVGKRIYLNSLAVFAVNYYLNWLAYETDWMGGDFADPILRSRWDIADLAIADLGKLECRPLWEGETRVALPPEATGDRLGYIIVELCNELNGAHLLGFLPSFDESSTPEFLSVSDLLSLDDLIDYLFRLESTTEFLQGNDPIAHDIRHRLEGREISEIAAQLERIYRQESEDEQPYAIKDLLLETVIVGTGDRNLNAPVNTDDDWEVLDLAESLLEKLRTLWQG